jgi:hypothetical protein
MPKVGNQHFGYGPAGIAKAKATAKKQGVEVEYHAGGKVKNRKIAARGRGAATRGFYARGPMA